MRYIVNVRMINIRQVEVNVDESSLDRCDRVQKLQKICRLAEEKAMEEYGVPDEVYVEDVEAA